MVLQHNTIAGLNRMALVVEQLMKAGSIGPLGGAAEGSISLTVEDLQWLGVTGVSSDNLGFVLSKLQSLTDPGSVLVSLAALQTLDGEQDEAKKLARSLGNAVIPGIDDISARALLIRVGDRRGLGDRRSAGQDAS